MCGINGFTWKDASLIGRMNQALKHRGPDDNGIYLDDNISLGHCRLSIIDLSAAGKQPMSNEDGSIWITFNGEIYNFQDIRVALEERGHIFRSKTDTEVVIHAYEEWGSSCLERFNGMWAFAIYNKNNNTLFLSRDRFGVKPLYYFMNEENIIFSSEIKGILEHPITLLPNDKAIYEYLALGFVDHSPQTFFLGINRLMPGECMLYDISKRSAEIFKWYDLEKNLKFYKNISEEHAAEQIRELLEDSIQYRLISDVPVGSCLSGGIDSSSIVYLMRKSNKNREIKVFSMVFPGKRLDESTYVDEVVKDTNVEVYKITPTPEDLLYDLIDLIRTQEEPFRSLSIYGQYKVMELANSAGMKVLLDGQGSDEIFAGYFIYYKYYLFESLLKLRINEAVSLLNTARFNFNDLILFPAMTIFSMLGLSKGFLKNLWLGRMRYLKGFDKAAISNPLDDRGFDLNRALYSDLIRYSIPQLLRYEDKNSMRWSIESRVPFLDYRLVELVMSLPSRYKIRRGVTKHILRMALKGMVSDKILNRRDKIGFATPDEDWLSSSAFVEMVRGIIDSEPFKSRKYWNHKEVSRMLEEHLRAPKKKYDEILWRIINTELWLRMFIDRDAFNISSISNTSVQPG